MLNFQWIESLLKGPTRTKSILVVEDDLFLKPLMCKVIDSIDPSIQLRWATSVEDALVALETGHFSLIISDYLLQGSRTGLALWDVCKKKYPKIPFLMMSGLTQQS